MEWQVRVILFTLLINIVWIIQVLRALHIRPTTQMLSDILSRLVETVAEQGEDMQVCQLYMALYDTKWQSKCKHTCCIRGLFRDQNNMQYGGLKHNWKIVMNIHVPINNLKLHDFVQQTADARSDTDGIQSLKSKSALNIKTFWTMKWFIVTYTCIVIFQGYVTEIILTLEAAVDNLDIEMRPMDYMREIFMSTPNLAKEYTEGRKGSLMAPRQAIPHHARSTSYSVTGPPHRSTHC